MYGLTMAWVILVAVIMMGFGIWMVPTNLFPAILSWVSAIGLVVTAVLLGKKCQQ